MSNNFEHHCQEPSSHNYTQNLPVRIAHIIGKLRNGGVEAVVMNYYRNIDRNKIQYDFIIDEDSDNPKLQDEIKSLGGRIIIIPPYQKQFAYQRALHKIFTENKYPLVYSHINTLSIFPLFAAWRAGIPIRVAHNHSTAGRGEFKRNILKYSLRPFAKIFPTELCACSQFAGEWLFGKNSDFLVWPNAIDAKKFAFDEAKREEMRKKLNIQGKFVVGHAGRFMMQKNHKFLLEIFAEIKKLKPEAVLLLAGDGPLFNMCREKVNELNLSESVIFAGSVHNMSEYYNAMDIFIFPSLYEGLGMAAVEAQVSGLPVICSDELPQEVKICDCIKFLSLNQSPQEWANQAINISQNHHRHDMSTYAREHGFDIHVQAAKLSTWYCHLLGIPDVEENMSQPANPLNRQD